MNQKYSSDKHTGIFLEHSSKDFDKDEFKLLTSFRSRAKYCQERFQRISSGSGRIVYKIDADRALKLAKNPAGVSQNITEITLSQDYVFQGYGISADIYEYCEDGYWLEMEYCQKLNFAKFKNIVGISFKLFQDVVTYSGEQYTGKYHKMEEPEVDWENEFISNMTSYMGDYQIPYGDLTRISSYGESLSGDVVLVDFGLNTNVWKQRYYNESKL